MFLGHAIIEGNTDLDAAATALAAAASTANEAVKARAPIYVLATGQSNANGYNGGSGDVTVDSDVTAWNGTTWVTMQPSVLPMGQVTPFVASDKPASNNATWAFAKLLAKRYRRPVRVILLAWGGNSITQWVGVGSTNYAYIRTVMTTLGNPTIDYLLWDQGEADAATSMTDAVYSAYLDTVIAQFRAEIWFKATTPICLTGLSYNTGVPAYLTQTWAQRIRGDGRRDGLIVYADTKGLATEADTVHFTGASCVTLGQRYFAAFEQNLPHGLPPFVTTTERTAIGTAIANVGNGVVVYDTDLAQLFTYNGGWIGQPFSDTGSKIFLPRSLDVQLAGVARLVVGNAGASANYHDADRHFFRSGNGVDSFQIDNLGNINAQTDNNRTNGTAALRWSVVYAGTGAINTSDARAKTAVAALTADEVAAAAALAREIGTFRFRDAIAEKGDAARVHVGLTVQRAIEIMGAHGLDPMRYGFICYDEWPDQYREWPDEIGPNGEVLTPAGRVLIRESGNCYGFRADELALFLARGFDARLAALESR